MIEPARAPSVGRDNLYTARDWRDRAEESRLIAEDMRHAPAKDVLLKIASQYDQLAVLAAKRDHKD
jgi:hypothetical protein